MLKKVDKSDTHHNDIKTRKPVESLFKSASSDTIAHKYDPKYDLFPGSCQSQGRAHHALERKDRGERFITQNTTPKKQLTNQSHACGDCVDRSFHSNTASNTKQPDVNIKYKNVCFYENESSSNYSSDEYDKTDITEHKYNFINGPIFCPITKCAKVTTPESILQHFCFEHSKLPRLLIEVKKPYYLTLIPNNLTSDTSCIAVFLRQAYRTSKHRNANSMHSISSLYKYEDIDPIFLMASKISITQNLNESNNTRVNTEKVEALEKLGVCISENIVKKSNLQDSLFSENEVLLLWVSDISYLPRTYKITVSRDDKKYSHSFRGNGVHIKDKNDALSIYKRSECLIVHCTALNRLVNSDTSMQVILKLFI